MSTIPAAAVRAAPLAAALALLAGCGGGVGSVSGTVTYKPKGKPVAGGSVAVLAPDGPRYGAIKPDGTYHVSDVPAGIWRVTVSSPDPASETTRGAPEEPVSGRPNMPGRAEEKGKATRAARSPDWFPIPEKYGGPDTSGLKVEVRRGATTFNIDLD